jgi:hypothetical protein
MRTLTVLGLLALASPALAAEVGQPAPGFTLNDLDGNVHRLADHKGKIVVLEWFNPGCPFVVNSHTKGYPMSFRPAPAATATFQGEKVALGEGADRTSCADPPGEACAVSAPLRFTAREAGEARVAGTVAFSVCSPERCLIEKVPLSATVAAR